MTASAYQRIATALETAGIRLGDVSGVTSDDEFARLVEVACLNIAAGRRDRSRYPEDADDAGAAAIEQRLRTDPDLR